MCINQEKKEGEEERTVKTLESGTNDVLNKQVVNHRIGATFVEHMVCANASSEIKNKNLKKEMKEDGER